MKRTFAMLLVVCLFTSCKKDKKGGAKEIKKVTKTMNTKPKPIDDSLDLSDDISIWLEDNMEGYNIVEKSEWLSKDYLKENDYLRYNEEIFAEGDFNGDGEDDFATFLKDEKGNSSLYVFHKTADGYKKYKLPAKISGEFLGAGIDVEPPGFVYGGNKEVGLEYNGLNYNVYEKSGSTFYYDSGRYKKVDTE